MNPVPVTPNEPIRADGVWLVVSGNMPAPAAMALQLLGPGGPPSLDVSAAWNAPAPGLDVTSFYNGPLGGPGNYYVFVRDTQIGGGDGSEWQIQMRVGDTAAQCLACVACSPFSFGGVTTAVTQGECGIAVSWDTATGTGAMHYDLYRDGVLYQANLAATSYLDTVLWGSSHSYWVEARDDCPSTVPVTNAASAAVSPLDPAAPLISGIPTASYNGALNGDCAVVVGAVTQSVCAPIVLWEVLRDGLPDFSGPADPFPYSAVAPGNGSYVYSVRVTDAAGNSATSAAAPVVVNNCDPPVACLHRVPAPDLAAFNAAKPTGYFHVPPNPGDNHVDDPTPLCPFAPGDRIAGILGNGVAMTFYDLNRGATDLRLRKDTPAGNTDVVFTFTP